MSKEHVYIDIHQMGEGEMLAMLQKKLMALHEDVMQRPEQMGKRELTLKIKLTPKGVLERMQFLCDASWKIRPSLPGPNWDEAGGSQEVVADHKGIWIGQPDMFREREVG